MEWYFIEPSDVWFFRDARPFNQGGNMTPGLFPPFPTTLAGAFRSYLLARSNVDFADFDSLKPSPEAVKLQGVIGSSTSIGKFKLCGPFLARQDWQRSQTLIYVPLPNDVFQYKNQQQPPFRAYRPNHEAPKAANWDTAEQLHPLMPPRGERQDEPGMRGWLNENALKRYLSDQQDFTAEPPPYTEDLRLGIGMDHQRRKPKDSMLYTASYSALASNTANRYGLAVQVNGDEIDLPEQGVLSLGGESRAAHFQKFDPHPTPAFHVTQDTQHIKLVLLTPAWFDRGWQPKVGWSKLLNDLPVELVSASLGRPVYFGGWDLARGWHKPMVACLPAGSVFFFEFTEKINTSDLAQFVFTESPPGQYFKELGFGSVAVGVWNWEP